METFSVHYMEELPAILFKFGNMQNYITMKLKCKTQFKIFEGILDVGDEVTLEKEYYAKDEIIGYPGQWVFSRRKDRVGREIFNKDYVVDYNKPIMALGGSLKTWRIKVKTGQVFDQSCFISLIGYKSLGEIFGKLEN